MSKRQPGLPKGYQLGVSAEDFDDGQPADIGDFLEEDDAFTSHPLPVTAETETTYDKVVPIRSDVAPDTTHPTAERPSAFNRNVSHFESSTLHSPPRKQINMTPEAIQMADELLQTVQTYSQNKHAKASELFHALVAAAYEARRELDLTSVPARGRWGSPTAKIFLDSLKVAFQQAIAQRQRHMGEGN